MTTSSPEAAAKQALHQVLVDAFAADPEVEVHYGPPPDQTDRRKVVWVAGHQSDEFFAAFGGPKAPTTTDNFQIPTICDAHVVDASPAGAKQADVDALELAAGVRDAIRQAIADKVPFDTAEGVRPRWGRLAGSRSDGPKPLEGTNGWVATVAVDVAFTARRR